MNQQPHEFDFDMLRRRDFYLWLAGVILAAVAAVGLPIIGALWWTPVPMLCLLLMLLTMRSFRISAWGTVQAAVILLLITGIAAGLAALGAPKTVAVLAPYTLVLITLLLHE